MPARLSAATLRHPATAAPASRTEGGRPHIERGDAGGLGYACDGQGSPNTLRDWLKRSHARGQSIRAGAAGGSVAHPGGQTSVSRILRHVLLVLPQGLGDRNRGCGVGCGRTEEARRHEGLDARRAAVPLTAFQKMVLAILADTRHIESYLAGGTALHHTPRSIRFSNDIDFFHDTFDAVKESFEQDIEVLEKNGYEVTIRESQPGFINARVRKGSQETFVDWAHDSAWRFMPLVRDEVGGLLLHEVDLAINKVLTLAFRGEVRDYVDTLYAHQEILSLGAIVWAAVAKDPGYSPLSLLGFLGRRGCYRPEEFATLRLAKPVDLIESKRTWLAALSDADAFIRERPYYEAGCLYYSPSRERFVTPTSNHSLQEQGLVTHFGCIGGILPRVERFT